MSDATYTVVLRENDLELVINELELVMPVSGFTREVVRPRHVGELVGMCSDAVRTIMVTADAAGRLGLAHRAQEVLPLEATPPAAPPFIADARRGGYQVDVAEDGWLIRVHRPSGPTTSVVLLGNDRNGYTGPFAGDLGDVDLVAGLAAFERAVGAPFGPSVGATGERLLLATHPTARGGTRLDARPLMPPPMDQVAEIGASWRRPLMRAEITDRWVHWYDANANYLGAYQAAELGRGEPAQLAGDALAAALEGKYLPAGIWHAQLPPAEWLPDWRDRRGPLPAPWSTRATWHTSPTIRRARELGVDVAALVDDAWAWPEQSRFTAAFAQQLRDARAQLLDDVDKPGHRLALAAVGAVYQRLHGRLGAGFRAGTSSSWARPDWMHIIRAVARVNFDRRIRALTAAPFAIDVDAVYFATDEPDPQAYAASIGLPLGPRAALGRFRHAGSVLVGASVATALLEAHSAAATREVLRAAATGEPYRRTEALLDRAGWFDAEAIDPADDGDGLEQLAAALAELG